MDKQSSTKQPGEREPRWSQDRRLRFVDFRLQWDDALNRSQLKSHFGISTPQASLDIGRYLAEHESNLAYDASLKAYRATPGFHAAYGTSDPHHYLVQIAGVASGQLAAEESLLGFVPSTGLVPLPMRTVHVDVLREIVHAIRERHSLDVDFQSIARDEDKRRIISPHAFAFDGTRWHVRAYCQMRKGFRDFVLGRILKVHGRNQSTRPPEEDVEWHREVRVVLVPDPTLSPGARRGIEIDFGMKRGKTVVTCRQAMLFYLLRSLNFDPQGKRVGPTRQVEVANLKELKEYLPIPGQP